MTCFAEGPLLTGAWRTMVESVTSEVAAGGLILGFLVVTVVGGSSSEDERPSEGSLLITGVCLGARGRGMAVLFWVDDDVVPRERVTAIKWGRHISC